MKNRFLAIAICYLMVTNLSAQNLEPKKDKTTKKYGYVNKAEEWIVPATYDDADKFKDGVAIIYLSKKEGMIGETGTVLIEPKFDKIEKFKSGSAVVKLNKQYGLIDKTGKTLCEPKYDEINDFSTDGIAITKTGKKLGLLKNDGTILVEPTYDYIGTFYNEVASISNNKQWGLINKTGKALFEPEFSKQLSFNKNGTAIAQKGNETTGGISGKIGIVKNDGSVVHEFNIELAYTDNLNFFLIQNNAKWVICDADGKIISKEFDEIAPIYPKGYNDKGIVMAKDGAKWGFVDVNGTTLIPFKFDQLGDGGFGQDLCAVKVGTKWGYIDRTGNYFKDPIYESAERFQNVLGEIVTTVKLDGKEYTLDAKTGEIKLKPGPVNDVANNTQTTTNSSSGTTTTSNGTSTSTTAANSDDWIKGTWKVTEEKMAGQTQTGNNTTTVSFEFQASGTGTYVQRYDVMANKTSASTMEWTLNGSSLKISSVNYTVTPSLDKKSMTMTGIMGSSWKLVKL